jgi:hypothetical protein
MQCWKASKVRLNRLANTDCSGITTFSTGTQQSCTVNLMTIEIMILFSAILLPGFEPIEAIERSCYSLPNWVWRLLTRKAFFR